MKTSKSERLAKLARSFITNPTEAGEQEIFDALNEQLLADGFDTVNVDATIEWSCVEHNIIHIFADEGQTIIEISPKSGIARPI